VWRLLLAISQIVSRNRILCEAALRSWIWSVTFFVEKRSFLRVSVYRIQSHIRHPLATQRLKFSLFLLGLKCLDNPTKPSTVSVDTAVFFFTRSGVFLFHLGFWGFYWKSGFFWLWSNFRNLCCITVFFIQQEYSRVSWQFSWVGLGLTKLFEI